MAVLLAVNLLLWHKMILTVLFLVGLAVLLVYAVLMQQLHHCFSFTGGRLMEKIHEYLLSRLPWDAGISDIHYEPRTENLPFVPGYIKITFRRLGLLYGKK